MGLCRKVLWAGQKCSAGDVHSICLYGMQKCIRGRCFGLGTNEPCWDGYPQGRDLDCRMGWYCHRGICVPQLPNGHTCYGEHPNECIRGHRCNFLGAKRQCTPEYSLPVGKRSSDPALCETSHLIAPFSECAPVPADRDFGKDCNSDADCTRSDGSKGNCKCKHWWTGKGAPRFCEMVIADKEKPIFMAFWNLRKHKCHHNWSDKRCARENEEAERLTKVREEAQASADPTKIPECAWDMLGVIKSCAPCHHVRVIILPILLLARVNLGSSAQ